VRIILRIAEAAWLFRSNFVQGKWMPANHLEKPVTISATRGLCFTG